MKLYDNNPKLCLEVLYQRVMQYDLIALNFVILWSIWKIKNTVLDSIVIIIEFSVKYLKDSTNTLFAQNWE